MVQVENITYAYGRSSGPVLDRVGFDLPDGSCIAVLGNNGAGKSTLLKCIDRIHPTKGSVVVVEKGMKLTYDISSAARLIDLDEYKIQGGEMLYGFVAGLMASNYDITDIYIDGILKVLDHDINRLGVVLDEMAAIAGDSVRMTVTVSADETMLPHNVKKYL